MTRISLVATGEKWIGYGIRSFPSVVDELTSSAKRELVMTIYVISDMKTVELLKDALKRGINVDIFINSAASSSVTYATKEILATRDEFTNLRVYEIKEQVLHAKILVCDAESVLLGSANPTFSGMILNYEMGFIVNDGQIAAKVLSLLRRLAK